MIDAKALPDKWIRQSIYSRLETRPINGLFLKVYDYRIPLDEAPEIFVIMGGQSSNLVKNKCEYDYLCVIDLEVISKYKIGGNVGSRVLVDDVAEEVNDVIMNTSNWNFPFQAGLKVLTRNVTFVGDNVFQLDSYQIFRKSLRCEFYVT